MGTNTNDTFSAVGTTRSKYQSGRYGPFRCDHCQHYVTPAMCEHPEVIADAKAGELKLTKLRGRELAAVDAAGCCEYERKRQA